MSGFEARETLERAVRRELFGPSLDETFVGTPVECAGAHISLTDEQAKSFIYHDASTGQELLTKADPTRRYGIGVLYGGGTPGIQGGLEETQDLDDSDDMDLTAFPGLLINEIDQDAPEIALPDLPQRGEPDSDDFDLKDANSLKPSAMAISFKLRVHPGGSMQIRSQGASYKRMEAVIPGVARRAEWWLREPFRLHGRVAASDLLSATHKRLVVPTSAILNDGSPDPKLHRLIPQVQLYVRPVPHSSETNLRLVTVVLVNTAPGRGSSDSLFQCGFHVSVDGGLAIEPYPSVQVLERDEEEQGVNLLYRNMMTFAIGHGCAANWEEKGDGTAASVASDPLPAYEAMSLTPNVYLRDADGAYVRDGNGDRVAVTVSMSELARESDVGRKQVEQVLRLYEEWIELQTSLIDDLPEKLRTAAVRHMGLCGESLARMQAGWKLVQGSPLASRAFALANEAILYQQLRSRLPDREVTVTRTGISIEPAAPSPTPATGQGQWRPFQIAFILASLPELVDPSAPDRDKVDLIFFPTGGGKTEAYLGAAAISLLARRLRDPNDAGTDCLMRYTLRLLTAQQFLRAAALICVLEDIRSRHADSLGDGPFSIGIWLGSKSTPNKWRDAITRLRKMKTDASQANPFLLSRCPWCGTRMGRTANKKSNAVVGYVETHDKVVFRCPDRDCRFGGRSETLPIHVVDEGIYEARPSLVIGTVDKFAMMAWDPAARSIFGLGDEGQREVSPPNLIVQDELHLISGPLGSMVGLYEPIIDELCTDRRIDPPVAPKIIASTATIRRYADQILAVFGRKRVALFPPHGLEQGHSFFAEPETREDGTFAPGRRYLGIMSGGLGSLQTVQVRVASATLMGAMSIPDGSDRDGYWTNLNFLNSLRELGNTVNLLGSDVPDYLTGLRSREGTTKPRWPRNVMELTSRRRDDEIPEAIDLLSKNYGDKNCVDICLASNIIEVGVDIDRLALMTIVGQPKTTAQYIQVSGRVGRKPEVAPGLVITIYGAAKPRDRSHYERFRTYHQQLYAHVEPTSVTPFATPVLRRALHAVAISYIRQQSPNLSPHPFPETEYENAAALLRARAELVNPEEMDAFEALVGERKREWSAWERTEWSANPRGGDPLQGLMRWAGTLADPHSKAPIWEVPTSMRNVDAECALEVSTDYVVADGLTEEGPR